MSSSRESFASLHAHDSMRASVIVHVSGDLPPEMSQDVFDSCLNLLWSEPWKKGRCWGVSQSCCFIFPWCFHPICSQQGAEVLHFLQQPFHLCKQKPWQEPAAVQAFNARIVPPILYDVPVWMPALNNWMKRSIRLCPSFSSHWVCNKDQCKNKKGIGSH